MNHDIKVGFTLVELMIIVAIIGILAAISVPLFQGYIKDSKKSEGREKVAAIGNGAIVYFHKDHFYNQAATDKRKSLYPDARDEMSAPQEVDTHLTAPALGTKAPLPENDLNQQPWIRLGFSPGGSLYYGFIYRTWSGSTEFTACAYANLYLENDSRYVISGDSSGRLSPILEFNGEDTNNDGIVDTFNYSGSDFKIDTILSEP